MALVFICCLLLILQSLCIICDSTNDANSQSASSVGCHELAFYVISQENTHHASLAYAAKANIESQMANIANCSLLTVHLTHEQFANRRIFPWTISPVVAQISKAFFRQLKWVVVIDEGTQVVLDKLLAELSKFDPNERVLIGKALYDRQPVIIHHFAFADNPSQFAYPDIAAGFGISAGFFGWFAEKWSSNRDYEFSIDPMHEFTKFAWDQSNTEVRLQHSESFCTSREPAAQCCTYFPLYSQLCGAPIAPERIHFAVKTCRKYHDERIPIIKKTWAPTVQSLAYYSEYHDTSVPTVQLMVQNTERGHCAKTIALLKHFLQDNNLKDRQWLFIADDDTLLNELRVRRLLACYDDRLAISVGERYGYGVTAGHGYNYITMGGGLALTRSAVVLITQNCRCLRDEDPDDMMLGLCSERVGVQLVHSPLFHQARPYDYPEHYLAHQEPITFHRYWELNPLYVFEHFLGGHLQDATATDSWSKRDEL